MEIGPEEIDGSRPVPFELAILLRGIDPDGDFIAVRHLVSHGDTGGEAAGPPIRGDQGGGGPAPVVEMGIGDSHSKTGRYPRLG